MARRYLAGMRSRPKRRRVSARPILPGQTISRPATNSSAGSGGHGRLRRPGFQSRRDLLAILALLSAIISRFVLALTLLPSPLAIFAGLIGSPCDPIFLWFF